MRVNLGTVGIVVLAICGISSAHAQGRAKAGGFGLDVQPIFGYERVQKLYPTAHQVSRLMFGARASIGVPLIAAELEYTRGNDTETIAGQTIDETDDRVKLGIRSRVSLGSLFFLSARAGGQAKKTTRSVTQAGTTTITNVPLTYHPYAGASVGARLGSLFMLEGGVTVIFTSFPDMSGNEYQGTLGFNVKVKI